MAPPSRDQIEQMAFMAMMDGIIHTSVPCNCASCKSDNKPKSGSRPVPSKRTGSGSKENDKPVPKPETPGACNHSHSSVDLKSPPSSKKAATMPSQNKNSSSLTSNPARSDKVNALLKADNVQAVFEVLNLTTTSKEEKDLATKVQNATKDCKLYQESRDKILELCDEEDDLDAVFGLLAKFRYERNMLTTAVIKGNSEREKALLCIQRVDHLMYMLQDVAKKKDPKGGDVMHRLGDIIVEIHDLAKTPSSLYDEYLDIKEEHFDLLNDHEEMHQKFVDVNSCHEKLHSSHDKLQTEHNKTVKDLAEAKKKASQLGGVKNDITRLEKAMDKTHDENIELKKEVERLNAELAKVNALKHENAQLKKKVTTLSVPPPPTEEPVQSSQAQASKKKKGKKGTTESTVPQFTAADPLAEPDTRLIEIEKVHQEQVAKLKKAHTTISSELDTVRVTLKQLEALIHKTENARDKAMQKLEVERATSQSWKDVAAGHLSERDRLKSEVSRHLTRAAKLQSTVEQLEKNLRNTKVELAKQTEAHKQAKEELEQRPGTPEKSVSDHNPTSMSSEMIRLLRKIKSETSQLARDLDDSMLPGVDMMALFERIHFTTQKVVTEVERDIEEILSVNDNDLPVQHQNQVPETILPFTYNAGPIQQTPQYPHREFSPRNSPQLAMSSTLPPYRPMIPPPGLSDASSSPFGHNQYQYSNTTFNRNLDSPSAPFSRMVEPPGLTANIGFGRPVETLPVVAARYGPIAPPVSSSIHSHSSLHSNSTNSMHVPDVGVIGSRSTSNKHNASPSPAATPTPSTGSAPAPAQTPAPAVVASLGNGAVGVDWNMWAKNTK